MENAVCSRLTLHIYPDLATEHHLSESSPGHEEQASCSDSGVSSYSISSSDDERYFFSGDLQSVLAAYLAGDYLLVTQVARQAVTRFQECARSELIKKNVANLTLDLAKLRSLTANAHLRLFAEEGHPLHLQRAKNCLDYEYQEVETPYKRAQRLNNLGLCQLLQGRPNNAFHHFSAAFRTYLEDGELRLAGLLKNIAEVYKRLEMYDEAVRYFAFVLEELDAPTDRPHGHDSEYASVLVSALECLNQTQQTTHLHLAICAIAKQLLHKMEKERAEDPFPKAKLKLELLRFGIGFGIAAKCITEEEIQAIFHEIFNIESHDSRLRFLKGQCCYAYREHFRGCNWQKFRELSRLAEACFNSTLKE